MRSGGAAQTPGQNRERCTEGRQRQVPFRPSLPSTFTPLVFLVPSPSSFPTMTLDFVKSSQSLYRSISSPAPNSSQDQMSKRLSNRLSLNRNSSAKGGGGGFLSSWSQRLFFATGELNAFSTSFVMDETWVLAAGRGRRGGGGRKAMLSSSSARKPLLPFLSFPSPSPFPFSFTRRDALYETFSPV